MVPAHVLRVDKDANGWLHSGHHRLRETLPGACFIAKETLTSGWAKQIREVVEVRNNPEDTGEAWLQQFN